MPAERLHPKRPLNSKKPISKREQLNKARVTSSNEVDPSLGFCNRRPFLGICFGPPGVGKTSFCCEFPEVGVLYDPKDPGIENLVECGLCKKPVFTEQIDSHPALLERLESLATGRRQIRTLVLDSLTGYELMAFMYHCDQNYEGNWGKEGFFAFQQGPKAAAKSDIPNILDALTLVGANGINVWLVAHAQVKTFQNPEGPDYDRYTPYCDKETWAQVSRWASMILFYNWYYDIKKEGAKNKADSESERRLIYTTRTAAYDAKNQYGLPSVIEAGESGEDAYNNFKEAYHKSAKARK